MSDPQPAYANFGEYIKFLRLERRLSLVKASKRMGFSSQKLCDIEMGRRYKKRVTLVLLQAVAAAYKVPFGDVVKHTNLAISHDKTATEILDEVWPKTRFAELLAESLVTEARHLAPEIEEKAVELNLTVKSIRGLLSLLRKRQSKTESTEQEVSSDE